MYSMRDCNDTRSDEILLAFYGDDFTGSTDCMEALALSGLETVLFLQPPDNELIKRRFPDIQCYGIAGISRSLMAEDMEEELVPIFEKMRSIPTKLIHYKICSTFDSSPKIGNIGLAIELGKKVFHFNQAIPLLVGAPVLKRYTLFGNHFASVKGIPFRLDRHPVMTKHPITPMNESDLRVHLGAQTSAQVGLMNILELDGDVQSVQRRYREKLNAEFDIILFDVLDDERLKVVGDLIWTQFSNQQGFIVGSSGVEYALTAAWTEGGVITDRKPKVSNPGPVDQIIILSGSCSTVTEGQIKWAENNGFKTLRVPVELLTSDEKLEKRTRRKLITEAIDIINTANSLILYSALGPSDDSIEDVQTFLLRQGNSVSKTGELIGKLLGELAGELIMETGLRRIVIAGGDTSGYVTRELGIYGLKVLTPIAPGSPLCVAYSEDLRLDELQIALKGGQVGEQDYFERVRLGGI